MEEPQPLPQILSPCSSGRRTSCDTNSPEFEFWMVRNPSFPQPNLLSADELFSGGFLLPLHHLHLSDEPPPPPPSPPPPPPQQEVEASGSDQNPEPELSTVESGDLSSTSTLTNSKRWRYIFKKNGKKTSDSTSDDHVCTKKKDISTKEKVKRDKKNGGAVGGGASSNVVSAAELNINIWPFSRSRSAGTSGTRPRSAASTRKVSSAPCSRSNSTGESKYKKWPNSPTRAGVHLGRSSPVWQVRRGGGGGGGRSSEALFKNTEKGAKKDGNEGRRKIPAAPSGGGGTKGRALGLNVPMCIGYRHNMSCRSDEGSPLSAAATASTASGGGEGEIVGCISGEGVRRSNLFNIRSFFTKKVH